jgi:response regulator RpfG family c-di-GMP phosphodiesterase
MVGLDTAVARLPIVLVVDPVAASRFTMWRLLSRSFGILEAPDALHARTWLTCRPSIDALIVQRKLPDADGFELVESLGTARFAGASRAILVTRPVDLHTVVTRLAGWFLARDARGAEMLLREADLLGS